LSVYQSSSSIADRLSASSTQSILSQKEKNGNSIKITVLLWLKIAILTKQGQSLDLEKASSIALSLIWPPGIFHS
jgi:hypothetical protein